MAWSNAAVKEARKVKLEVTMTPILDPEGSMESCDVQFQIVDQVPKRKSRVYTRAGLYFNEMSPDAVHQRTIDDATEPERLENAN